MILQKAPLYFLPVVGSIWAYFGTGLWIRPIDLTNLYPIWKWSRQDPSQKFKASINQQLRDLNQLAVPETDAMGNPIRYSLFYTNLPHNTPISYTGGTSLRPGKTELGEGDGVVPTFSMRGNVLDANNWNLPATRIPAFASSTLSMEEVNIPGMHAGYLEQDNVMDEILARVFGRLCQ